MKRPGIIGIVVALVAMTANALIVPADELKPALDLAGNGTPVNITGVALAM